MATNGRESTAELLARLEVEDRAAAQREWREHADRLEEELAEANRKLAELTAAPPLRRSQLSAKQKSEIIRARGLEFYNKIAW